MPISSSRWDMKYLKRGENFGMLNLISKWGEDTSLQNLLFNLTVLEIHPSRFKLRGHFIHPHEWNFLPVIASRRFDCGLELRCARGVLEEILMFLPLFPSMLVDFPPNVLIKIPDKRSSVTGDPGKQSRGTVDQNNYGQIVW